MRFGILTGGGDCPGLNAAIRAAVRRGDGERGATLIGFHDGWRGLVDNDADELTNDDVRGILPRGGTILGTSGVQPNRLDGGADKVRDALAVHRLDGLIVLGGEGTIGEALELDVPVIGIPKTIDNDVPFVQTTFGFETAVTEARRATSAAAREAESAQNGVGLVKLMGRDSGFIAAFTALVDTHVDFCLVPEVPFTLDALLAALRRRLEARGHAVVVVAEGAGQELVRRTEERDASGNLRYGDVGVFLRDVIREHFRNAGMELNLKYIDPSYTIRSVPANAHDSALCLLLGHNAVHAAMSGRTMMTPLATGFQGFRRRTCRDEQDCQVYRVRDIGQASVDWMIKQRTTARVDIMDRARITTFHQVPRQTIAQLARLLRCADDNHAARVEHRCYSRISHGLPLGTLLFTLYFTRKKANPQLFWIESI